MVAVLTSRPEQTQHRQGAFSHSVAQFCKWERLRGQVGRAPRAKEVSPPSPCAEQSVPACVQPHACYDRLASPSTCMALVDSLFRLVVMSLFSLRSSVLSCFVIPCFLSSFMLSVFLPRLLMCAPNLLRHGPRWKK